MFADDALVAKLRRSFRAVFAQARPEQSRRVVLLVVDRTPRGNLQLVDAAAMLTTSTWLPADSSFEVHAADALVAAGRQILKPLRYDHRDAVLPDFVLLDVQPPVAFEVWGLTTPDYQVRKRAKQQFYSDGSQQLGLLEWDVNTPLPDLHLPGPTPRR